MKLQAILILFCYILLQFFGVVLGTPILIKPKKDIEESVNNEYNVSFGYYGGEKELKVKSDSTVKIEIKFNPAIGCNWNLVNEEEIKESEVIELQDDTYKSSCADPQMNGCDGNRILTFYIQNATKKLPNLNLVCKRSYEEKNFGSVKVTLTSEEQIDVPVSFEPEEDHSIPESPKNEFSLTFKESGKEKLLVQSDSMVYVHLKSNPSTGYVWTLVNEDEIQQSQGIEFRNSSFESDCGVEIDGCGGTETFSFYIADATKQLPRINMIYKRPWEKDRSDGQEEIVVNLLSNEFVPIQELTKKEFIASFGYEGGEKELSVSTGSIVKIELKMNPSTGYSWEFVNESEIKESEVIEFQDDTYQSSCTTPGLVGCGGTRTLIFLIRNASQEIPDINLVYKRTNEIYGEATVHLRSDEFIPNQKKVYTASFNYDGGKEELLVENNSYVDIKVPSNPSSGFVWFLVNEKEFKSAEGIEYQDTYYKNHYCQDGEDGCSGIQTFKFYISNALQELPEIHIIYKRSLEEEIYSEVFVSLKSSKSKEELFPEATAEPVEETTTTEFVEEPTTSVFIDEPTETDTKLIIESKPTITKSVTEPKTITKSVIIEPTPDPQSTKKEFEVTFGEEGGEEEISVKSNSILKINVKTYSKLWFLVNEDEFKEYEGIEYQGTFSKSDCGLESFGCGGTQTFSFYITDASKVLPKIYLVYKSSLQEQGNTSKLIVSLISDEQNGQGSQVSQNGQNDQNPSLDYGDGNTITGKKEYSLSFDTKGGEEEVVVESDSIVRINVKTNASTGYSWTIVNEKEIEISEVLEYQGDTYKSDCANPKMKGCGSTRTLSFYIKDASEKLPKIHMVYKRSNDKEYYGELIVSLKPKESIEEPAKEPVEEPTSNKKEFALSFGYEGGKEELFVESDSIVKLELKTNPSTGYSWHFVNEEEVKGLGYIELQDDTYQSACENNPRLKGCGGTRIFLFYIRNASKELPKLHLVYKRSHDVENYGEVVVTLKSDENTPKEMTKKLKTIDSTEEMKEILTLSVENVSILNIEISDNTSLGNQWVLGNIKNLRKYYSHLVEFEKSSIEMVCNEKEECERVKTFTFRIKDATKKLPKLDFVYTLNETGPSQQEYIINLQGAVLDGNGNEYKCEYQNYFF